MEDFLIGLVGFAILFACMQGMIVSQFVYERALVVLGADTLTFTKTAPDNLHVILLKAPFTPGPNLVIGDVTEADFPGYLAIDIASGAPPQSLDPTSGNSELTFLPVSGSQFTWETTSAPSPAQTIYGFALVNADKSTLWASQVLPANVVLNATNQRVSIPLPTITQLAGTMI